MFQIKDQNIMEQSQIKGVSNIEARDMGLKIRSKVKETKIFLCTKEENGSRLSTHWSELGLSL